MSRVLLLGPAPGRGEGGPLDGRCGARLAALAGVTPERYAALFDRENLLDRWPGHASNGAGDRFPIADARRAALVHALPPDVVFVGAAVARLFGLGGSSPCRWYTSADNRRAWLPHPSGRNRWYNDPAHVALASRFLSSLVTEVRHA